MHIHLPYLIFPWNFNEIRLVVSENSRGHEQYPIYSCRTHQRAITLGKIIEPEHTGDMRIHLWYLIFPWSFIEIRQAVSENLRGQERDGRTDARTHGRTDARTHGHTDARTHGRSGDYMLPRNSSGSIIKHWQKKQKKKQQQQKNKQKKKKKNTKKQSRHLRTNTEELRQRNRPRTVSRKVVTWNLTLNSDASSNYKMFETWTVKTITLRHSLEVRHASLKRKQQQQKTTHHENMPI